MRVFRFVLILLALTPSLRAADWYVAPDGKSDAAGTREAPWDIGPALVGRPEITPGDTVYLMAGTYHRRPVELFDLRLTGRADAPIRVRGLPGARVTIDGGLQVLEPAAHLIVSDLEILVSEPQPEKPVGPGSHPEDFKRPWGGLQVHSGHHCTFANLVIHDCRQGVSWWRGAIDSELHGCLIYDNGWPATDRGHGHAIYTQNETGTKRVTDNIMTGGHSYSMHAYGSERAFVNGYHVEGNIAYAAGPFLIGGGRPSEDITVIANILHGVSLQIGYDAPNNEDCTIKDNLIVNGGLSINRYKRVTQMGNTVVKETDPRPQGSRVIVRPNRIDPDRANVAILNWEKKPTVPVNASTLLKHGDRFRLMNPRDFYGKPVIAGEYSGPIDVPVEGEFAAFVLLRG